MQQWQMQRLANFFVGLIATIAIARQLASQYDLKTAPASTGQRGTYADKTTQGFVVAA